MLDAQDTPISEEKVEESKSLSQRRKEVLYEGDESDKTQAGLAAAIGCPLMILIRFLVWPFAGLLAQSISQCHHQHP